MKCHLTLTLLKYAAHFLSTPIFFQQVVHYVVLSVCGLDCDCYCNRSQFYLSIGWLFIEVQPYLYLVLVQRYLSHAIEPYFTRNFYLVLYRLSSKADVDDYQLRDL